MVTTHNLGFPRIGAQRELKFLLEQYWRGDIGQETLLAGSREIRDRHWRLQAECGLDLIPVNDFSLYDHVLDMSTLLGVVPERFSDDTATDDALDLYFRMARGRSRSGKSVAACEMTKWFDTNYHYLVPELQKDQEFQLAPAKLFDEVDAALAAGHRIKPVLLGPLTYLWLGKCRDAGFDKLDLLEPLLVAYRKLLDRLAARVGVEWVQIDEPVLTLDLPPAWQQAFLTAYEQIKQPRLKILLTSYFGGLNENLATVAELPVQGLHIDIVRAPYQLDAVLNVWPADRVLSLGLVDGRNVWRADPERLLNIVEPVHEVYGDNLWLAPSCSLLHCPVDLEQETKLDRELKSWLAFAVQKLEELNVLAYGVNRGSMGIAGAQRNFLASRTTRKNSGRIHDPAVQRRLLEIDDAMTKRENAFALRAEKQQEFLGLPLLPTTTIGSFPQTATIRKLRREFRLGAIDRIQYEDALRREIKQVIEKQEQLGLDVLVHGEAERNDMVEYFAEQLQGFAITEHGWVQSYGSRCVKPPIIYGDVSRPKPMTVDWIGYAQSLTDKPVKGMLTGPVTILQWSFVRDDQPRSQTCKQIALALRDEILDLENAGISLIQVDEPALREGLPLRKAEQAAYLKWAIAAFRLATAGVKDTTQIHTHMCYAEFNDIIEAIAALDADVISIEAARSDLELLEVFRNFAYPNQIGPGVYDIHSPNVVSAEEIQSLLEKACEVMPAERLWVNPDCGLKTRDWPEVEACLANMVAAARALRERETGGTGEACNHAA